ncbi:MAG: hypothetical protein NZM31_01180 [Gemmatales bacterium]|nr:hypothetical protein [Gemmatales bacterium]MDW8385608.1 hypothetical protein [Gemmatales bacterium]
MVPSSPVIQKLWQKMRGVLAVAAGLAVFAPIPAFAFTWLMPFWTMNVSATQAPIPTLSFTDNPSGGNLLIDMRHYTAKRSDRIEIAAKRDFQVAPGGETLNVSQFFETLAQRAGVEVLVRIKPLAGGNRIQALKYKGTAGSLPTVLSPGGSSLANSVFLTPGNYRLVVKIKYNKRGNGLWDNSPPPPGSPHRFTFSFT